MNCLNWCARAALLLGVAAGLPAAHADTLTFDDPALANLYAGYIKIPVGDYRISFQSDGGLIGKADDLPAETAPIGNSTQFVTVLNTGFLTLTRGDAGYFDLLGFDLAYVPHPNSPPPPLMAFVLRGTVGGPSTTAIMLDTSLTNHPFATFNDPTQLADYRNIKQVTFSFCSYNPADNSVCGLSLGAAGQFAMDNIVVRPAVPELPTLLLMSAGMAGVLARRRKTLHTSAQ